MAEIFRCRLPSHILQDRICRWPDNSVTWCVIQELPGVPLDRLEAAITWGLDQWAKVCDIKPRKVDTARSARILVGSRRIDGPTGILAECELPCGIPQVRLWFDVGERWTSDMTPQERAIVLPDVAWHELGHALGLGHAPQDTQNIMAPVYNWLVTDPGQWDIREAVVRYGRFVSPPIVPPIPTPPLPPVPGGNMDRDTLRARIAFFLTVAKGLTRLTSATWDDQLVGMLETAVSQYWILDFIILLMGKTGPGASPLTVEEVVQALHQLQRKP